MNLKVKIVFVSLIIGVLISFIFICNQHNKNQRLEEYLVHIEHLNDSLRFLTQFYILFDELEVRVDPSEEPVKLGEVGIGRVYVLATLSNNNHLLPEHKVIYWSEETNSSENSDTVIVNSMFTSFTYSPSNTADTIVQGFYEFLHNDKIVSVPFKTRFAVSP